MPFYVQAVIIDDLTINDELLKSGTDGEIIKVDAGNTVEFSRNSDKKVFVIPMMAWTIKGYE